MVFTVITLKKTPQSLKGDLTKWMQEISQGVYVGNFNSQIREKLWQRVIESVDSGEATISFAVRNEVGYDIETLNTERKIIDYDGLPLVTIPDSTRKKEESSTYKGYSKQAKFRKARKFSSKKVTHKNFVVIDIETTGTDISSDKIIEIGAIKVFKDELIEHHHLIKHDQPIPKKIIELTGITSEILLDEGVALNNALLQLNEFIGDLPIVGYNINFDLQFLNKALKKLNLPLIENNSYDLMKIVKKEKILLKNYHLETVLNEYEIEEKVPHRALSDAKLIYKLTQKVNKFDKMIQGKG